MLIKEVFLYRMKHIKEAIAVIMVCLVMSLPMPIYADSLQEVLRAQSGTEFTQEENHSQPASFVEIFQERTDEKLAENQAEVQRAAEEVERARIREAEQRRLREQGALVAQASENVSSPGAGFCAKYVSLCYQAAGFGYPGGNACDMYWNYCTSSNREDIIPGMIIAVPSHTGTYLGSIYGHVGIIVARDGQYRVRQNVGPITEVSLDEWIAEYSDIYEPRWGFAAQI